VPELTEDDNPSGPATLPRRRFLTVLALIIIGLLAIAAAVFGVIYQLTGAVT
jgi:hypothetical protein